MSPDPRALAGLARSLVIYRARPWRAAALARFYRGLVGPGDLAFDIGAHVGNRSRALVAAGARVVALEPQALFHRFLARDLPPGVTLLRAAAGRAEGEARLAVSRLHPTVSSLAEGFADRMVLSHDAAFFSRVTPPSWRAANTPHWQMSHLSTRILPELLSRGVSQDEIDQMMVRNPARLLTPTTSVGG